MLMDAAAPRLRAVAFRCFRSSGARGPGVSGCKGLRCGSCFSPHSQAAATAQQGLPPHPQRLRQRISIPSIVPELFPLNSASHRLRCHLSINAECYVWRGMPLQCKTYSIHTCTS